MKRARSGDRDCFGQLVSRHQGAVCGVAYAICGDFAMSEDLAQESFVAAWEQLRELQEPSRFRAWVCGIARLLSLSHVRRRARRGDRPSTENDEALVDAQPSAEPSPRDLAAGREEKALLWRTLDRLPDNYREPLVLFYREQQSIAAVSTALDLTEDAVKQRLSRGRALLREELAHSLEGALARTRPGPAFTTAVLAALPALVTAAGVLGTAGTAKAATAAGAGSGGGPAAATTVLPLASMAGGLIGALGLYLGYRYWRGARMSPVFRRALLRLAAAHIACAVVALGMACALVWGNQGAGPPVTASLAGWLAAVVLAWVAAAGILTWTGVRRLGALAGADPEAVRIPNAGSPVRWQTRGRFLGLPWMSVALGADRAEGTGYGTARGWIAVGDVACGGIYATGSVAVAPIAFGGVALGAVALGGIAVGGLALGGLAIGTIALAGAAVGWTLALGGAALAADTACGGVAIAGRIAAGGMAHAPIVGGEAWALVQGDPLAATALKLLPHAGWVSLVSVPFLLWAIRRLRTNEQARRADGPGGRSA